MSENIVQEVDESWELEIESGAAQVTSLEDPAVPMTRETKDGEGTSELEEIQRGGGPAGPEGNAEKAQRREDEPVMEKKYDEGEPKEDTETGDKRKRLDVKVQKGEEQADTGAKKAKVAEEGKKKRQAKTQAKAKIHATETVTQKKGRGRPRKTPGTKKKADDVDVEEGQKAELKETAQAIN